MPIDSLFAGDPTKVRSTLTLKDINRARRVLFNKATEIFTFFTAAGATVTLIDDTHAQTIAGVKTFTAAPVFSAGGVNFALVSLTNAEIKALRATPKTLVAAPGAGLVNRFLGAELFLKAGANVLTESGANLAVKYTDGSGVAVSSAIEATGFIDQAASTATSAIPIIDAIVAKTGCDNKALVLHNVGGSEIAGNAANDALLYVGIVWAVNTVPW